MITAFTGLSEAIMGLIGVIVGSIITIAKDLISSWLDRKRDGHYAATRIISILEEYVNSCVDVVYDDGTSEGRPAGITPSGEWYYDPQVVPPQAPVYPEDINWNSINKQLLYRILMMPTEAKKTDRHIYISSEHSCPPDYEELFEARQLGYAHLALESLAILSELRKEYGLPEETVKRLGINWDAKTELEKKIREIEGRTRANVISF